jgi:hypothetical protein
LRALGPSLSNQGITNQFRRLTNLSRRLSPRLRPALTPSLSTVTAAVSAPRWSKFLISRPTSTPPCRT